VCCATSFESWSFNRPALTALALTIAAAWLMEFVLMHASLAIHLLMLHVPYIGFYAMFDTATWRYGVPLAMGPALFYAASPTTRVVPAAHLTTIALGALFTVISSGWIAPELIRRDLLGNTTPLLVGQRMRPPRPSTASMCRPLISRCSRRPSRGRS
jgi:hypothetical protein